MVEITKELLEDLYVKQGLTIRKCAIILNVHRETISSYLKKYNISIRKVSNKNIENIKNVDISKKWLLEEHINKKRSLFSMAKEKFVSKYIIVKYLKKYGIKIVKCIYKHGEKVHISKEQLEDLYVNKKLTTEECSKILNTTSNTIVSNLKKHKIELRDKRNKQNRIFNKIVTRKILEDLYITHGLSATECGIKLNISGSTIADYLKKFNIKLHDKIITKEEIYDLYTINGLSIEKCSKILKVGCNKILRYLHEYNIEIRKKQKYRKLSLNPISREQLLDLYSNKKMTIKQCSNILDIGIDVVSKYLKIYKIDKIKRNPTNKIHITKEILIDLYVNKNLSSKQCGNILNCSYNTILKKLKQYEISIRNCYFYSKNKIFYPGSITPNYNRMACKWFSWLNLRYNLNGLHGESEEIGEYCIVSLNTWLDYWEKDIRLCCEWMEQYHYKKGHILRDYDVIRINNIEAFLKCRVFTIDQTKIKDINDYEGILNQNMELKNYIEQKVQERMKPNELMFKQA